SKKYGIPYVLTEHYTGLIIGNVAEFKFNRKIIRAVYKESSHNIIVSAAFASDLSVKYKLPRSLFHVLPNMVNKIFLENNIQNCQLNDVEEIRLFTNSFLTPKKDHKLLISSFYEVLKTFPSAKLFIGGDGELRNDLAMLVSNLGIESRVI